MSDDDAATITGPLRWFNSDVNPGPAGWRLDVVTLLAVIGESSVAEHGQAITASMLCLLPRIIPAPQALLTGNRPIRMPEVTAKMTGVYSGVVLDSVGFFANIIHPLDELHPFSFQVLKIEHVDRNSVGGYEARKTESNGSSKIRVLPRWIHKTGRTNTEASQARSTRIPGPPRSDDGIGAQSRATSTAVSFPSDLTDVEAAAPPRGITRRETVKEKMQDYIANPTLANMTQRPAIPAKLYSPIHVLTLLSTAITIGIIVAAAIWNDGTAILAVFLMASTSSIVGFASWWKPILMNRSHTNKVPAGDVVIRTREGGFILIKCTEEVARELYAGTEECEYRVGNRTYKVLMALGTFLLMIGVILLGNCQWNSQVFIGGSYIMLNGLYWCMGLLPRHYFWDLSRYRSTDITPQDSYNAHRSTNELDPREGVKSFTRTLWYVIRETKRTAWVERSGAAPSTPQWRAWLVEAEEAANEGRRDWPAVARKDVIMKMSDAELFKSAMSKHQPDPAQQVAPAVEVQPQANQTQNTGAM